MEKKGLISLINGVFFSSIYWIPMIIRHGGILNTLKGIGIFSGIFSSALDTSGGLVYGLMDFIIAPMTSKMDQPTGLGIVVFGLLMFSFFLIILNYKKVLQSSYWKTILLWLVMTFIMVEGNLFPIKLMPHRAWVFFAIPVSFLVGEAIFILPKKKIIIPILLIGILITSGYSKYTINTSQWPAGVWYSNYPVLRPYLLALDDCGKEGYFLLMQDINNFKREIENEKIRRAAQAAKNNQS